MEILMSVALKVAKNRLMIGIIIDINYFRRWSLDTIDVSGRLIFSFSSIFIVMGFTIINGRRVLDTLSRNNGLRNGVLVLDRHNLHGICIGTGNSNRSACRIGDLGLRVHICNSLDILSESISQFG
jgi:hypothetical protein